MGIALEETNHMQMDAPGLELAHKLYNELAKNGDENKGTQALLKLWKS